MVNLVECSTGGQILGGISTPIQEGEEMINNGQCLFSRQVIKRELRQVRTGLWGEAEHRGAGSGLRGGKLGGRTAFSVFVSVLGTVIPG